MKTGHPPFHSPFVFLVILGFSVLPTAGLAQGLHPALQGMVGKWTEKGILIPAKDAAPIQGVATFVAEANPDGEGLVLKGSADFGPIKWTYIWTYVAGKAGGESTDLKANYRDSLGQNITYKGRIENEISRLQLIANLSDGGKAKAQVTVEGNGKMTVQNVTENPAGETAVRYQGEAVREPE